MTLATAHCRHGTSQSIPSEDDDAATLASMAETMQLASQEEIEAFLRVRARRFRECDIDDDGMAISVSDSEQDADAEPDDGYADGYDSDGTTAEDGDEEEKQFKLLTKADQVKAQAEFQRGCVRKMKCGDWCLDDVESMPNIEVPVPDSTRCNLDESHFLRRKIVFWSPTESHRHKGVKRVPCVNAGYDHSDHTVLGGWRKGRRVRASRGRDYFVAGRDVKCMWCNCH